MAQPNWCPRCSDWRGYLNPLCKGCQKIEEMLLQLPGTITDPKTKLTVPIADATPEMKAVLNKTRREMTSQRFEFISRKRTERESYTQALEQMVDENVDSLKTLAYQWAAMRIEAKKYQFSNMYAWEMTEAMNLALSELGAVSLELSKYEQNPSPHNERMTRITQWMEVMQKFQRPDASEAVAPVQEGENQEEDNVGSE